MKKLTIEKMHRLANFHGGKCLSETYINSKTKLLWECAEEHKWETTPDSVKGGSWCPRCAGLKKHTIEKMRILAQQRGGICQSDIYKNNSSKLLWECAEKHRWEAIPKAILKGHWCRICGTKNAAKERKLTIEEMNQIAKDRGGKCLSKNYKNKYSKLLWKCAYGHRWKASPDKIKNSMQWCSECSSGLGERICRSFFEQLFKKKFPKSYPKWLVNKENNRLELDGYCKEFNIAFEHQGQQHYKRVKHFTPTKKDFQKLQKADELKRQLCKSKGLFLVQVPEIPAMLPIESVKEYLRKILMAGKIPLPDNFDQIEVSLKRAFITNGAIEAMKELIKIAKKRNGKCLSESYINNSTKLLWECSKGHQWRAIPNSIKNGKWCIKCAGLEKTPIGELHNLAEKHGGKCLSDKFKNMHDILLWECKEGHRWYAKPASIKHNKSWCPDCSGKKKKTIKQMQKLALDRGGKCLSNKYVSNRNKLLWECSRGHQWLARPGNVIQGQWCPDCGGTKKLTIEKMQILANSRGGNCLSYEYQNARSKLLWECRKGHKWETTPSNIKKGSWCPKCLKEK